MPKTFQDAIVVTTKLSVSYLWIDALCIVQDSVDSLEWRQEASIMGDIYANSYFTWQQPHRLIHKAGYCNRGTLCRCGLLGLQRPGNVLSLEN